MATNTDGNFKSWPDGLDGIMKEWFNHYDLMLPGQAMGILTPAKAKTWKNRIDKKKREAIERFYGTKKKR